MAEEKKDDGLPSLNLKGPKEKETTSKAGGALLPRMPRPTPSALPQSGLLGRFRGMAKKDMGLMAAAGALMALLPIAENFMMKPDKGVTSGKTGELFEPNGTVSYGSPGNGEMITPLTARDPMSLILSGEDEETKPVPAATEEPAGGGGASDGFRESVREPFQRAVERARAAVPTPRSLSFRGGPSIGGGGGSTSSGGIAEAAKSAPNAPADRGMSGAYAPGLRGFGRSVGSYSGVEGLKGQGDELASRMNRGSALSALAGMGGEFGEGPGSAGPSRPSAPEDTNQNEQEGDKYKLQPPKPKKNKEPGGGGGLQPWFKEMKEMEAKGEIDRAAALQKFEHESRMEFNKWLRESIKTALDTTLVNPLKEYLEARIKQKYAGNGEEAPADPGNVTPPPNLPADMGSGDGNKAAYEGSYDDASSSIADCKAAAKGSTGSVPIACDKAKSSLDKAVNNLAAANSDYTEDYVSLSSEYDELSGKISQGKDAYHTASLGRNQSLNTAEANLATVAKETALLEAACAGKTEGACAVYQSLNPKGLAHAVGVLRGYEGAVGRVYNDADTLSQSMKSAKSDTGDLLESGEKTVGKVQSALSDMSGLPPEEYAKKLEDQLKVLGPYEKPEADTAYDIINKASADSDAEDAETSYWKSVQPYDWLTEAGNNLNDPEKASLALSAKPKTYKDDPARPASLYRLKAMVGNSKKLPDSLESVVTKLDQQIIRVKDQSAQVPKIYKSSPELQAIIGH